MIIKFVPSPRCTVEKMLRTQVDYVFILFLNAQTALLKMDSMMSLMRAQKVLKIEKKSQTLDLSVYVHIC
ncbi:hypothetical protein ACSVDA_11700 [Cytobacillus sp. Hm23]